MKKNITKKVILPLLLPTFVSAAEQAELEPQQKKIKTNPNYIIISDGTKFFKPVPLRRPVPEYILNEVKNQAEIQMEYFDLYGYFDRNEATNRK